MEDWFKEKWIRRTQELLDSDKCPLKANGDPDWSAIEYRIAWKTLWGYRNRGADKQDEIAFKIKEFLIEKAQKRWKLNPTDYAERTVNKILKQMEIAQEVVEEEPER